MNTREPNAIEILESALAQTHRIEEREAFDKLAHAIDYVRIYHTN